MSKRNTYLLGGAAIAVGIALIVIAITSLSGDGEQSAEPPGQGGGERAHRARHRGAGGRPGSE